MQENNSVPTPEIVTQVAPEKPKQSDFLVILLSVLLVVSVAIAGFFAYQTQKLVGELRVMSDDLKQKTEASSEPVSELIATESSEIDPTADWETFIHKFGYSMKYPQQIKIIPMKNFAEDITPTNEYSDIMLSSQTGFDMPHLRILRLRKDFSDTGLTNMQIAQKYYQANLDMPSFPATSVQAPKQDTFLGITSVSYAIKNKGFMSVVDQYVGYEGIYRVVWFEKDNYKYMIYWTENKLFDQILSSFKFTN
ncbi:MAG: hypothetical protein WA152_03250 [Microgenomates group bacterium]